MYSFKFRYGLEVEKEKIYKNLHFLHKIIIAIDFLYVVAYNVYIKKIVYYKTEAGKCPYLDWYNSLDNSVKAQITKRILRVSEGNFGDSKKLNTELSELRFKIGSGYRIYYTEFENYIVVLLSAGNKSSQQKDIKNANNYLKDLKERCKNE